MSIFTVFFFFQKQLCFFLYFFSFCRLKPPFSRYLSTFCTCFPSSYFSSSSSSSSFFIFFPLLLLLHLYVFYSLFRSVFIGNFFLFLAQKIGKKNETEHRDSHWEREREREREREVLTKGQCSTSRQKTDGQTERQKTDQEKDSETNKNRQKERKARIQSQTASEKRDQQTDR